MFLEKINKSPNLGLKYLLEFEIINYLVKPLSTDEIKTLIKKLNIKPIELVRQKEAIWIEHYKGKLLSDVDIIKAMAINPIVIERPIVIKGNKY